MFWDGKRTWTLLPETGLSNSVLLYLSLVFFTFIPPNHVASKWRFGKSLFLVLEIDLHIEHANVYMYSYGPDTPIYYEFAADGDDEDDIRSIYHHVLW